MASTSKGKNVADERTPLLGQNGSAANGSGSPSSNAANSFPQETALSGNAAQSRQGAGAKPSRQVGPDMLRGVLMMFMAIDHTSVSLGGYAHGQGIVSEGPATVITAFNDTLPYILRCLSHLCAPGFAMLMGMGLAYWSTSRIAKGQKMGALVKHLLARAGAILILNEFAFVKLLPAGFWLMNAVMWALAIDYVIIGVLACLILLYVEPALAKLIEKSSSTTVEVRNDDAEDVDSTRKPATYNKAAFKSAARIIDVLLLAASFALFWVNIWTSPHQGECHASTSSPSTLSLLSSHEISAIHTTAARWDNAPACPINGSLFYNFFFQQMLCPNLGIISAFPPFGWIGAVVFGLVYGRILLRAKWSEGKVIVFNSFLAVVFAALFVATRLFGFGNLSTHCLHTPAQELQKHGANQYLASFKSFFYVTKYPPSPAYLFATLSGCFLLLCALDLLAMSTLSFIGRAKKVLLTWGTNSSVFYAFHLLAITIMGTIILATPLAHPLPSWSMSGKGTGLGWTFLITYLVLLVLSYYFCKAFAAFKARKGSESVWRFF